MDGKKILPSIMHALATPELMSKYTMTGKTSTKNVKKEKFKKYVNVIGIIWRVANADDKSYTKAQCRHDLTYVVIKNVHKFRFDIKFMQF